MIYICILYVLAIIIYLTGFFDAYAKVDLGYKLKQKNSLIEYLTQHKNKSKIYTRPPVQYNTYNRSIPEGNLREGGAQFRYEFPLVNSFRSTYECVLTPQDVSLQVDLYGLKNRLIIKNPNGYRLNDQVDSGELHLEMNQFGWYFKSYADFGVDYANLVQLYNSFAVPIAKHIYQDLHGKQVDSYFNRVQAALNFVQFIPYGQPEFDTEEWFYFGISTPPESFILGYSDCDSKSIFFAAILSQLIPKENIVLIDCTVGSNQDTHTEEHMMVAVSDLNISGTSLKFRNKDYILLETTSPIGIGEFSWSSFKLNKIIALNK